VPGRADAQIERRSAPLKAALEQVRLDGAICFRTELTEGWALSQVARNTRRDFMSHLLVYVLVNSFIVLIWVITGSGGFLADLSHGWLGHRRGHECMGRLASS
jgi:uncharacterized membrane-anchored protein